MKINADRAELADVATWVAQAIPKRPHSPALSGMKITASAEDQAVTLSAFDYEVGHTATLDAQVLDEGTALVAGHLVRELVGALPGAEIDLTADEGKLTLQAGRSTYRANLLDLGDYPSLPTMPKAVGKADAEQVAMLVRSVKHVIDDAAPIDGIRGLRLEASALDGQLRAVGLSSPSLATATCAWSGADFDCQVPVRGFEQAIRGMSGDVTFGREDGLLGLSDGHLTVTQRTFDGAFAKWQTLLRGESPISVDVDVAELLEAVKRASLTSVSEPVFLSVAPTHVEVIAGSAETADGSEIVDAQVDGAGIELAFGAPVLAAALAAVPSGRVTIGLLEKQKPVIITPSEHPSLHLVMPRRAERAAS